MGLIMFNKVRERMDNSIHQFKNKISSSGKNLPMKKIGAAVTTIATLATAAYFTASYLPFGETVKNVINIVNVSEDKGNAEVAFDFCKDYGKYIVGGILTFGIGRATKRPEVRIERQIGHMPVHNVEQTPVYSPIVVIPQPGPSFAQLYAEDIASLYNGQ